MAKPGDRLRFQQFISNVASPVFPQSGEVHTGNSIVEECNLVPGEGIEPSHPYGRRILSPVRIPVPPSRLCFVLKDFNTGRTSQQPTLSFSKVLRSAYYRSNIKRKVDRHPGRHRIFSADKLQNFWRRGAESNR